MDEGDEVRLHQEMGEGGEDKQAGFTRGGVAIQVLHPVSASAVAAVAAVGHCRRDLRHEGGVPLDPMPSSSPCTRPCL